MHYESRPSITIEGSKLRENCHYHLNIILNPNQFQIIKGTVYNQKQEPSPGAVIQVTQISRTQNRRSLLGYAYTDEHGKYLFAIQALPYMCYEMTVYSPLS